MESYRRGKPRQHESADVSWPVRRKYESWVALGQNHPHEGWASFYVLLTNLDRLGNEELVKKVLAQARACSQCTLALQYAEKVLDGNSPPDPTS